MHLVPQATEQGYERARGNCKLEASLSLEKANVTLLHPVQGHPNGRDAAVDGGAAETRRSVPEAGKGVIVASSAHPLYSSFSLL